MRAAAALSCLLFALGVCAQDAGEPVPKAELQLLSDVVRLIKRDFARATDDAVLASGCAEELAAVSGSTERGARSLDALPGLLLRARASAAGKLGYRKLATLCVEGMVGMLDKHSQFLDEEQTRELYRGAPGAAAIGLELGREGDGLRVVDVYDEAPAAKAGVRPGDILLRIDGAALEALPLREAVNRLRGAVGSTVVLQLRRAAVAQPLEVTARREVIRQQTVRAGWAEGDVLELRINRLTESTRADLQREILKLVETPARNPRGIVLDLRSNSGGLLSAAVDVGGAFLEEGVSIGSTRGRAGRLIETYRADDRTPRGAWRSTPPPLNPQTVQAMKQLPMAVLVTRRTASGGEILAAALQANGRAVIVGEPTLGMGSIQTVFPLGPAGRGMALKMTSAYWHGPKDIELDGKPLEPDLRAGEAAAPGAALRWLAEAEKRK